MDDLFVEVHKRRGEKFMELDQLRLGRRGSGTVFGIKQLFTGLRNLDTRNNNSIRPSKHGDISSERASPAPEYLLRSGVSISRVDQTLPLIVVDPPYAPGADVPKSCPHSGLIPAASSTPVSCKKTIRLEEMKKVPTDPRIVAKQKQPTSNTQWYVSDELLSLPSDGAGVLHHAATTNVPLSNLDLDNTISDASDGGCARNPTTGEWVVGDAANDLLADEIDGQKALQRTREAMEHYKKKISRIMQLIKAENHVKEENVNEYLQLSAAASADKIQLSRIKAVFEKKNQKSMHLIAQLQRKLEISMRRLKEVETHGVSGSSRQGKGVLKDVGHGIKTIVSKPKEFAHLLRNKFGSADNISGLDCPENDQNSEGHLVRRESITLPSHFKFHSTDNMMMCDSQETGNIQFHPSGRNDQALVQAYGRSALSGEDISGAMKQLEKSRSAHGQLQNCIAELQGQIEENHVLFKQALEEEKVHRERLEEQVNDMMELHQNEVANLKQELTSFEEKMEYQLEERTRDMQELLESCQTKITKMDLQQQQQLQLISMESFDNSTLRTLVTKLINVVLAMLAVLLVLINTATNLLQPFINTRIRCFVTIIGAATIAVVWRSFDMISDASSNAGKWLKSFVNL